MTIYLQPVFTYLDTRGTPQLEDDQTITVYQQVEVADETADRVVQVGAHDTLPSSPNGPVLFADGDRDGVLDAGEAIDTRTLDQLRAEHSDEHILPIAGLSQHTPPGYAGASEFFGDSYCGATTATMAGTFISSAEFDAFRADRGTMAEVIRDVYLVSGSTQDGNGMSPSRMDDALNAIGLRLEGPIPGARSDSNHYDYAPAFVNGEIDRDFLTAQIDAGHPVLARGSLTDGGGGHWYLIVGYERNPDDGTLRLIVNDPNNPELQVVMSEAELATFFSNRADGNPWMYGVVPLADS